MASLDQVGDGPPRRRRRRGLLPVGPARHGRGDARDLTVRGHLIPRLGALLSAAWEVSCRPGKFPMSVDNLVPPVRGVSGVVNNTHRSPPGPVVGTCAERGDPAVATSIVARHCRTSINGWAPECVADAAEGEPGGGVRGECSKQELAQRDRRWNWM